ncbi:cell division protein FtsA [Ignatzschineria indica]|uniref:Cell division protein FtsA n=1 Tax=Ignatzschineria indica TaxID=472583 RepID=A0A2U2ANL9_9GAMM|nr:MULTISPECIES: cell division protein FtsA [Ignatzschineria]MDM1544956.1 cell division protein FtsA [Ignatzschineria indica]OYQ81420.1 cell division protein FtsA [Ignatzschineria sp. F8392]PWD84758.1 cell division protein FtsA [Ignatzschineria indica]GGZ78946.1 cell division protein FtsA [Ignatzschineria indica]
MTDTSVSSVGVCIDIGTNRVVGMMAEIRDDGSIEIIRIISKPSRGIKQGSIANIAPISNIVRDIIAEFEREENVKVLSVSTSITGTHIRSRQNNGVVTISGDRFTEKDNDRILQEAGKIKLDAGESVLHVLPQKYIIDGGSPVENAIGLSGVKFTLDAHLVTASTNAINDITNCITESNVEIDNIIYEGVAAAISVLTEDEMQRGVTLINIGAGITDVVVYKGGAVVYHSPIPLGGNDVTTDIAKIKRYSTQVAESIKLEHGSCLGYSSYDDSFKLPVITNQTENRTMSRRELSSIIEARYREIFEIIRMNLEDANVYLPHDAGVVLTGGGSMIPGCADLAQEIMEKPCRIGTPLNVIYDKGEGLTPEHATVVGLLASHKYDNIWQKELQKTMPSGNFFSNIYKKITGMCRNYF